MQDEINIQGSSIGQKSGNTRLVILCKGATLVKKNPA